MSLVCTLSIALLLFAVRRGCGMGDTLLLPWPFIGLLLGFECWLWMLMNQFLEAGGWVGGGLGGSRIVRLRWS